jgi:hypothetical protein
VPAYISRLHAHACGSVLDIIGACSRSAILGCGQLAARFTAHTEHSRRTSARRGSRRGLLKSRCSIADPHAGILRMPPSAWVSLFLAISGQEMIHVVTDPVAEPMTDIAHGIEAGQHGVALTGRQGSRHLECLLEHPHQSVAIPCSL